MWQRWYGTRLTTSLGEGCPRSHKSIRLTTIIAFRFGHYWLVGGFSPAADTADQLPTSLVERTSTQCSIHRSRLG